MTDTTQDLVKRLRDSTEWFHCDCEIKLKCADRMIELEAKLAQAVEALMAWKHYDESDEEDHVSLMLNYGEAIEKTRATLAELTGQGDE